MTLNHSLDSNTSRPPKSSGNCNSGPSRYDNSSTGRSGGLVNHNLAWLNRLHRSALGTGRQKAEKVKAALMTLAKSDPEITRGAVAVLEAILSETPDTGSLELSRALIADAARCERTTVSRAIKALGRGGYINHMSGGTWHGSGRDRYKPNTYFPNYSLVVDERTGRILEIAAKARNSAIQGVQNQGVQNAPSKTAGNPQNSAVQGAQNATHYGVVAPPHSDASPGGSGVSGVGRNGPPLNSRGEPFIIRETILTVEQLADRIGIDPTVLVSFWRYEFEDSNPDLVRELSNEIGAVLGDLAKVVDKVSTVDRSTTLEVYVTTDYATGCVDLDYLVFDPDFPEERDIPLGDIGPQTRILLHTSPGL